MMRRKKCFAWVVLLVSALALRVGLAVESPNIFFPDEIFQTLEPAHRLAYGYGIISWEWRLGIRSWVLPTFLAGVMRATAWMGAASAGYVLGTAIVLSLLSLVTIWFGYAWAKRASGEPAAVIAALACSFYFGLVYFAPKALYEVVAAHAMLPGLYFGIYGGKLGERMRFFLAGLFCALAACLRMQLLPALLFALVYFCYPQWRARILPIAAGASLPVLFFGLVDWITWSYPWQSFVRYYEANMIPGIGRHFWSQPWYWYALVLIVLIGPPILLLFHGARRRPFLAIFCLIVVFSHSFIAHKEIRFIYPVLAPALTLASMGAVDLLGEIKGGMRFLDDPKWVIAVSAAFLLISSAALAAFRTNWTTTRWGDGAFDRLSRESSLCGVGIYGRDWWESGGYTHLHRNVPIVVPGSAWRLGNDAPSINALIAPDRAPGLPSGFAQSQCWQGVCLYERPGTCSAPPAEDVVNAYLRGVGQ